MKRHFKWSLFNFLLYFLQVREATSNDPWGPSSSLMSEIADLTYNVVAFSEIMSMVWKRLNDHGKNWRHVYKVSLTITSGRCGIWDYKHNLIVFFTPALTQAMTLMEYLIKTGSERVAQQCRENIYAVQTLKDFQYIDRDGKDQVYTNKKLYLYMRAKEACYLSLNKEIKVELSVLVLKVSFNMLLMVFKCDSHNTAISRSRSLCAVNSNAMTSTKAFLLITFKPQKLQPNRFYFILVTLITHLSYALTQTQQHVVQVVKLFNPMLNN